MSVPADAVLPQARPVAAIGVAMLDTCFPRPPGDIGHPATFAVPVLRRVVQGAWPRAVVTSAPALRDSGLADRFLSVMRALVADGADVLTTSCGFLVLLQHALQAQLPVPLATSSLLQLPALLDSEPQVGVLTISAAHLGTEHLRAAGVPPARLGDVRVQGVDAQGVFARCILGNLPAMDLAAAEAEVVDAACRLAHGHPGVRTLVLECTNMPPYAAAIRRATRLRVLSLRDDPRLAGCFAAEPPPG